jgi:hypothetical protein
VSDERTETESERNERNESIAKETCFSGDSRPLGFIALLPIPAIELFRWGSARWPQPGLGPGVGAQVAS